MQQFNYPTEQVFVPEHSALDLYSELYWSETESRKWWVQQNFWYIPSPSQVLRKVKHLKCNCVYIHIS